MAREVPGEEDAVLPLFAALGPVLTRQDLHLGSHSLVARSSIVLPANIQFAWAHPSKSILYVATSDRRSGKEPGAVHHLSAIAADPGTAELRLYGTQVRLAHRPIHISADAAGGFLFVAFSEPSALAVYALQQDGSMGHLVDYRSLVEICHYPHHIQTTRDGRLAILVARGVPDPTDDPAARQRKPGSLNIYRFDAGALGSAVTIAPGGGDHFGPRDVAFHPTRPWIFVSLETQNQLVVFERQGDGIKATPVFTKATLTPQLGRNCRQLAGAVQMHPSGRFLYCANRGNAPRTDGAGRSLGKPFNGFTVFAIDQHSGEPTAIQHVDSGGYCPRTFSLDESGRVLVAANAEEHSFLDGQRAPANLAVFRITDDGRLELKRTFAPANADLEQLYWTGFA